MNLVQEALPDWCRSISVYHPAVTTVGRNIRQRCVLLSLTILGDGYRCPSNTEM